MSMSENELRRRGLNFVRRQIAAGKATKKDVEQWTEELGPEVQEIANQSAPPRARPTASKPDTTSKES